MRLIGDLDHQKEAFEFYSFLQKKGISGSYEPYVDPKTGKQRFHIWIEEEDQTIAAEEWLTRYKEMPQDALFTDTSAISSEVPPERPPHNPALKWKLSAELPPPKKSFSYVLTNFFLILCVLIFFWNAKEESTLAENNGLLALELGVTPVMQDLLFDYPLAMQRMNDFLSAHPLKNPEELNALPLQDKQLYQEIEKTPTWKGFYFLLLKWPTGGWGEIEATPRFEKIKEGEVWRLFTPCLLHQGFLHILFNMAWLWILGRQIEERLSRFRMLLLFIVVGIVSNVIQYWISGPFFVGFSGIVVGMTAFITRRQKIAPWEGYPLQRTTALFVFIYVGAMFALEVVSFTLQFFSIANLAPGVANTAHIVGGLTGMLLGRLPFFARGKSHQ